MKKLLIILIFLDVAIAQPPKHYKVPFDVIASRMTEKEIKSKANIEFEFEKQYKNILGGIDSIVHYTIYRNGTWKKVKK